MRSKEYFEDILVGLLHAKDEEIFWNHENYHSLPTFAYNCKSVFEATTVGNINMIKHDENNIVVCLLKKESLFAKIFSNMLKSWLR